MDDCVLAYGYAVTMLNYARHCAVEALRNPRRAVLATDGPAGIQAGEFPCEAIDLNLFLLVPKTSDHLYNLEHDSTVTILAAGLELRGKAQVISPYALELDLDLLRLPGAEWCELVRVDPRRIQIRKEGSWANLETIDL